MTGKIAFLSFFLAVISTPLPGGAAGPGTGAIPPGESGAKAALERSPRHHEWADIAAPGKTGKISAFIAHTCPGAGHGFLRAQDGRDGANLAAAQKAWPATVEHLKKHLE